MDLKEKQSPILKIRQPLLNKTELLTVRAWQLDGENLFSIVYNVKFKINWLFLVSLVLLLLLLFLLSKNQLLAGF
jgi:hypothetical protein